jgi:predicted nuclease with TOPRIM domain
MSNTPLQITVDLADILAQINQKLDKIEQKFDDKLDKIEQKFDAKLDKIDDRLNRLEIGQESIRGDLKTLDEKVGGLSKRIDNQEFLNRTIAAGLLVAILVALAKMFGFVSNVQ